MKKENRKMLIMCRKTFLNTRLRDSYLEKKCRNDFNLYNKLKMNIVGLLYINEDSFVFFLIFLLFDRL